MNYFNILRSKINRLILPKEWGVILNLFKSSKDNFLMFHSRPKYARDIKIYSDKLITNPICAIVIQGPIDKENDFTLETIKLYKKIFEDTLIILSILDYEDSDYVDKLRGENIHIVINKKPDHFGPFNINLQLLSSLYGIKKAKELGATHVLKTRADQRIYGTNAIEFLCNLERIFPLAQGYVQKERIISTNTFTLKYRPYLISDMTVFGNIDDMLLYWGADLDIRAPFSIDDTLSGREITKLRIAEIYIVTEFLKKLGHELRWTIQDYWQILADHFCIIDSQSIDLYWHKATQHKFRENKFINYDGENNMRGLTFREWINLYSNLKNRLVPEIALDLPPHRIIPKDVNSGRENNKKPTF